MQQIIGELGRLQVGYHPNPETCAELNSANLTAISGPAGTGKTTLLDYVVDNYDGFGSSVGFTTRQQRPYERADAYTFYPHDEEHLQMILEEARDGSLAQIAVHPTTGFVYGSRTDSYRNEYNLIDLMADAVSSMRALPFSRMAEVAIVCSPAAWGPRFAPRLSDPSDANSRVVEGISGLELLLERGESIAWLDTSGDDIVPKAEKLVAIAKAEIEPDSAARAVGEQLLKHLKTL